MNFVAMLAILSVPFFAIWILALRGAARAGGNGVILSMDPDAQPIEPQFSGAEKLVDRGVSLTAADVALYNAHRFATCSDHSIGDLSISRVRVGSDPFWLQDFFWVPEVLVGGERLDFCENSPRRRPPSRGT